MVSLSWKQCWYNKQTNCAITTGITLYSHSYFLPNLWKITENSINIFSWLKLDTKVVSTKILWVITVNFNSGKTVPPTIFRINVSDTFEFYWLELLSWIYLDGDAVTFGRNVFSLNIFQLESYDKYDVNTRIYTHKVFTEF